MSEDLVNQITLNFLISKQQLHKLNKKIKQKEEDKMKTDIEIYKEQFVELFNKMLNDDFPNDLLEDVKHSYNYFVEKSIYYLKMRAETNNKEEAEVEESTKESNEELSDEDEDLSETNEDEEDEDLSETNEDEEDEDLSETNEDNEDLSETNEDDEDEDLIKAELGKNIIPTKTFTQQSPVYPKVYKKVNRPTKSKGVEDIKQLPLDWFSKVKQTNKQNQIIPRSNNTSK